MQPKLPLATNIAAVGLLASVSLQMLLHVDLLSESLSTKLAHESLSLLVDGQVRFQPRAGEQAAT